MRVVGIVRVSQRAGREGASFVSPREQRSRIEAACEKDGMELVQVVEEIDVSGGTPLEEREGLRGVIESVEAGQADVVMVAYFDRLFRSLTVQAEVLARIEAAGGEVVAVDVGAISANTSTDWLKGTMFGTFAEYQRRIARERGAEAQRDAVARGVCPFPSFGPGYRRGEDGVLVPDPGEAATVLEAFHMRDGGATVKDVRAFLMSAGIKVSYHGTMTLLKSRIVLGEIHFGKLINLHAHEPIVPRDLWQRVQNKVIPRGPKPVSDLLLARLGVLRCGNCGARMTSGVQTQNGRRYPFYRCPPTGDCGARVTIGATIAEGVVVRAVREKLSDLEGRAAAQDDARKAAEDADRAQADLDAALRAFAGLEDEAAARERLTELREQRDAAVERADQLSSLHSVRSVSIAKEWDRLTPDEQRGFIRATVERAEVGPVIGRGRAAERVSLVFR